MLEDSNLYGAKLRNYRLYVTDTQEIYTFLCNSPTLDILVPIVFKCDLKLRLQSNVNPKKINSVTYIVNRRSIEGKMELWNYFLRHVEKHELQFCNVLMQPFKYLL